MSRVDFNKQGESRVKRRKFSDIDITKDFEKRLEIKTKQDQQDLIKVKTTDLSTMSLEELEQYRKKQIEKEKEDEQNDTTQMLTIDSIMRGLIQSTIKVHQTFEKHFEEFTLHPEIKKKLEILDYKLTHNLPIEKELLFETVPEFFKYEINQLTEDQRTKYNTRRIEFYPLDGVLTSSEQRLNKMLNESNFQDKILDMKMYVHYQNLQLTAKYQPFLRQAIEWGWYSMDGYIKSLLIKDFDKLSYVEKLMYEDIQDIKLIEEEIKLLEDTHDNLIPECIAPFPLVGKFKENFLNTYNYAMKFRRVKFEYTMLCPIGIPEERFDDRLRKLGFNIDEEIKKSRNEMKQILNTGGIIKRRSLSEKDPELIKKVNIISQAIKNYKFTDLQVTKSEYPLDYLEENLMGHLPLDGRILIDEYFKALYLNNENPETYNINYWKDYFKVSTQTLRNIFNYVFFPIPDEKNPSDVGRILYFKDAELANRRKLIEQMSGAEFENYLFNTETRPELEELKRLDYIKYQATADQPRISERTIPYTYEELDEELDNYLSKSDIIKEIDRNISKLADGIIENTKLEIDKDILNSIEAFKKNRIEDRIENNKIEGKIEKIEETIKIDDK